MIHLLKKYRVPYVLYFHGKGYSRYASNSSYLVRWIVRKTLSHALGGLVLGNRLKSDVNPYIPDDRLYVLPNCVPDIEGKPASRSDYNGVAHVIFLSNLVRTKGPMEFLKMAKAVSEKGQKVRFTLAGGIADKNFFQELIHFRETEGLNECVDFPGPLYGKNKDELFRNADIFVFPTLFSKETFGLVNIEAMKWGLPVISSNEGVIPDIIQDGINGYIVDPKNTEMLAFRVLNLIRDPALRQSMGRAGRDLYEKHYSNEAYEQNVKEAINYFINVKGICCKNL